MTRGVVFHVEGVKKISLRSQSPSRGRRSGGRGFERLLSILQEKRTYLSNLWLCVMIPPVACPLAGFPLPALGLGAIPRKGGKPSSAQL